MHHPRGRVGSCGMQRSWCRHSVAIPYTVFQTTTLNGRCRILAYAHSVVFCLAAVSGTLSYQLWEHACVPRSRSNFRYSALGAELWARRVDSMAGV
ncbi:hypothetical protein DAEQUDRAFT_446922 [Daedalea quercina L-15889]|uniref:Uncharacterized protein n=1 Tax=Daedalea quercina L-15889 TaxID=1314783 RepID=A0A165N554_9APHY|nr:hypothetical protein DAEQUDRAFT_446922 [Daedalea quercina L-15889]